MTWYDSGKARELFVIQICCAVFVYLSVPLRIWAQCTNERNGRKHAIHDKLMYISVILYTAQAILIIRGIVLGGIGQDAGEVKDVEIAIGFQTWYFGELLYATLSCLVKTSVVMYLRQVYIGSTTHGAIVNRPYLRVSLIGCLVCIWTTSIAFFFTSIFQCTPVDYYWEQFRRPVGSGTCARRVIQIAGIVLSIVLALTDFALALVSVTSLWNARLPRRTKFAIAVLTSLGALAGAAMIVRIFYIKTLELTKEFLYETVDIAKWTVIEATLGIVGGCLPTFWPLLRRSTRCLHTTWSSLRPARLQCAPKSSEQADGDTRNCRIQIEGGLENNIRHNRGTILFQREFRISEEFVNNNDSHIPDSKRGDPGIVSGTTTVNNLQAFQSSHKQR